MTIRISTFNNVLDKAPKNQSLTKTELLDLLTKYPAEILSKTTAKSFIAGHFKGNTRKTENLQFRSLITLDLDHCDIELSDLEPLIEATLHPHGYCAYSTASHAYKAPKIRIVLFLEKEVLVTQYKIIVINFINSINMIKNFIDIKASSTPCQLMLLPFKSSPNYTPWYKIKTGNNIDPELYSKDLETTQKTATNTDNTTNNSNKTFKSLPLNLTEEEVIKYLKSYPQKSCDYHQWLDVGKALHHQFNGNDRGKLIWHKWSIKYKNNENNISNIDYKWTTFKNDKVNVITFASIIKKIKDIKLENSAENIKPLCVTKWLHTKGKNVIPMTTIENFQILLNEYNIKIYFDEILKEVKMSLNNKLIKDDNSSSTTLSSIFELNNLKLNLVDKYINLVAQKNVINSWKDLILSYSNTKTDNFDKLCDTVIVDPKYNELKRVYLKQWLLQMLHITCLNDDYRAKSARMILVFQGKQGIGKTSWFRSLVPDKYSEYILEGHTLNVDKPMNILTCIKHVFVELGELAATFRKSDMEQFKSFITNTVDELDKKYIPHPIKYRRRTVFFGSVNDRNFLQDETGNSRFLVLPVLKCNARHNINMFDLYAELLEEAKINPDYDLTENDLAIQQTVNCDYESIDYLKEKFEDYFDVKSEGMELASATKTLEMLGFNVGVIKKTQVNKMAQLLNNYGYYKCPKSRKWKLPKIKCTYWPIQ
jgi:predicted P-loop ATPase